MFSESLVKPKDRKSAIPRLGESLIIIARWEKEDQRSIVFQDFILNGRPFIPVFSSWDIFNKEVSGTPYAKYGLEIKINFLFSVLKGHELLILNPGSPNSVEIAKEDLNADINDE